MLDLHLYLVVSGFLTWVGKTSHISDSHLISAGCYGSYVYERLGEPLGVCSGVKKQTWEGDLVGNIGLVRSLHNRTAAICNGGSKSYYLQLFSYITCLGKYCNLCFIWLYIKGSDINLRNVLSSVQVDSTGGLMLITTKMCL